MLRQFSDIKIFVISLAREKQRREVIQKRLNSICNTFEFFDAIDGKKERLSQHNDYIGLKRRLFYGKDLSDGELGCFFSHRALINKIVQKKIPFAVILEDDAILLDNFRSTIEGLLNSSYPWDIVRFLPDEKLKSKAYSEVVRLFESYNLIRLATAPGEAHAYILSMNGAKKMQCAMRKIWCPNDTLMGQPLRTHAEILTVFPSIAEQDKTFISAIGDDRFEKNRLSGWERLVYPLTRGAFKLVDGLSRKVFYFFMMAKNLTKNNS